jgi:hypothetical protein
MTALVLALLDRVDFTCLTQRMFLSSECGWKVVVLFAYFFYNQSKKHNNK